MKAQYLSEIMDDLGVSKFTVKVLLVVGVAMAFDGFDYMIVSYTVPSLQAEWGLSSTITGSLSSWSLIGLVLGGLIAGPLADKMGRRKALASMTIIYGILNLPLYFSNSWEFFAFFRVLAGTGLGATIPMVTTCFSEWVPSKNRSFFITVGMAFMSCGWLLAGVIGGALSNATAAATINEAMVTGGESAWSGP